MGTWSWNFLKTFLKPWAGKKEQCSTSKSSQGESYSGPVPKVILEKLALLADENRRLKEELRIRDMQDNARYDV